MQHLALHPHFFINDAGREPESDRRIAVESPATCEMVGSCPEAVEADVNAAVSAASAHTSAEDAASSNERPCEAARARVQTQLAALADSNVWLLTTGSPEHAGSWGFSRSARAEASLPLVSMQAPLLAVALACGASLTEPEATLNERKSCAPRLKTLSPSLDGLVRLHFHARGAISNLFLEPQPPLALSHEGEVLLRVRAVGLNFRDVLNVLGEYPGDPGPPGGDCAGVVVAVGAGTAHLGEGDAVLGWAHAPLAHAARADARLLGRKPRALSFEAASTLPTVWSTVHVAFSRAALRAGRSTRLLVWLSIQAERMRSGRFPAAGWVLLKNLSPVDVERLASGVHGTLHVRCRLSGN